MARRSIQSKLLRGILSILLPSFLVTISVVVILSVWQSQQARAAMETQIRSALLGKGKLLVVNNAQALSGMAADNAFLAIQDLVARTVSEDEDVIYGIYMNAERQAWVIANDSNPSGAVNGRIILEDSTAILASRVQDIAITEVSDKRYGKVLEFVAAVKVDGEVAGWIRYGISTRNLQEELAKARGNAVKALAQMIGILLLLALLALAVAFALAKRQSRYFSKPIQDLNAAANIIAGGDYKQPIETRSDDEVGDLAVSFENMRRTVQNYTEHLEDLVNAKMRQVRDILDNINQGLFTVNPDGRINDEYSRSTNAILGVSNVAGMDIEQALRLSALQRKDWFDWVELVKSRLGKMRWEKLARLAPVLEFDYADDQGRKTVKVDYQPVLGKNGELERIMVLVQDVTETRKIERIIAEEKQRHENEVKTILGLVNTLPEVIQDFFKDTETRIGLIERNLNLMQAESERARAAFPSGDPLFIDPGQVASVARDLHTIKGNAATYGFEALSALAHQAEEVLDALRPPIRVRTTETIKQLKELIRRMQEERLEIDGISRKLRGGDQKMVYVADSKIQYVRSLVKQISADPVMGRSALLSPLFEACLRLRHVSLSKLTDRYRSMVERVSERMNKQVQLVCEPELLELPPTFFKPINEAVVHILRNAVDHGIEDPLVRSAAGKALPGRVRLAVAPQESGYRIEISDDGQGIDKALLIHRAQELGFVRPDQIERMTELEKLHLIFIQGLSTKEQATEISGRGMGLHAVRVSIEAIGGHIQVMSEPGMGTVFILEIPTQNLWEDAADS